MKLTDVSSRLGSGELTALEHVRCTLRKLDDLEGTPWSNLVAARDDDRALAEARVRSEEASAGRRRGPLDGVSVIVKDNIDVVGLPTRAGSAVFDDAPPAEGDADIVSRLREAGAIVVGKAHLHELAYGSVGDVNAGGPARHPQDPGRITGGSSSGSAALVALGVVPLAIGTDTGCSVRAPAALTGITGLMPSLGLLPTAGVLPVSPSFDHVGLLAADPADVRLAWSALHPFPVSTPSPAYRIAVPLNPLLTTDDVEAAAAVDRVLASLRGLGHSVVPWEVPGIEELAGHYPVIVGYEMRERYRHVLDTRPDAFQPATRKRLEAAASYGPDDHSRSLRRVEELRARIATSFDAAGIDVLAVATTPFPAPLLGRSEVNGEPVSAALLRLCVPFSVLGVPVVSVPDTEGALPVGVQLVGAAVDEAALLELAVDVAAARR